MNKTNTLRKRLLTAASLATVCSGLASAATFSFAPFEFDNATVPGDLPNDPALSPIDISLTVAGDGGTVYFVIQNSSDQTNASVDGSRPVVTNFYIEDSGNIFAELGIFDPTGSFGTVVGGGVSYHDASAGGNLPGGNGLSPSFDSTSYFRASPSPAQSGVDPGEYASFAFASAASSNAVALALINGDLRVGIHVQQIGANGDSAAFILDGITGTGSLPEPGSTLLCLLGSSMLLLRRRR